MTPSERLILIAGAGIGGLTAALALARQGFRCIVAERAPELAEVGAGLQLTPNASRVLGGLGLDAALDAHAVRPDALRIHSTRAGREIARMPLGRTVEERFGAPYRVIHRADLQALLAAAVTAGDRVELRLDAAVDQVEPTAAGARVTLVAADGHRSAVDCDAVVGADGVWSRLRTAVVGGPPARYTGHFALRATLPIEAVPEDLRAGSGVWMAPRAHLVHYPVNAGRAFNIVAILAGAWRDERWSVPIDRAEVLRLMEPDGRRWPEPARGLIHAPERWTRWALAGVDAAAAWTRGPVALLGDAAHSMLPFAAQGAAMAIEDAEVLARELATNATPADAFAAYERRRKPRVRRVVDFAQGNGRIYDLPDAAAFFRDAGIALLSGRRLLERQAWIYGWRAD